MNAPNQQEQVDIEMIMNASAYFVAKHYGLSRGQVWAMDAKEFQESFAFASAAERLKAEEMEKMKKESKGKMRVAGTDAAQPMPFSE